MATKKQSPKKKALPPDKRSLEQLEPLAAYDNPKTVAFKTVDIFAGIIQRKLWLKHEENGVPRTNGHSIIVDLDDEHMYRKVEHELSHILFLSDFNAKVHFVTTYSAKVIAFAKQHGQVLDVIKVEELVDFTVNLIEDHRVDSLWGMLYPGSAYFQKELNRQTTQSYAARCHESYLVYFACVEGGAATPPGPMDVYRPLFEKALQQVARKGFLATLVLSKWLITQLLAEIVKHTISEDLLVTHRGSAKFQATPEERVAAIVEVLKSCKVPDDLRAEKDDLENPAYPERGAVAAAKKLSEIAVQANVTDEGWLEATLIDTESAMTNILAKVQEATRPTVTKDEWIRKDSMAKVVFRDIQPEDVKHSLLPIPPGDLETVRRLKALFLRVMGRRRAYLEDAGVAVDVQAFIERQTSGQPVPCFRQEQRGQGFKTLVLLDRSYSMAGKSTKQAERACRIIGRALRFPFVQTSVWGFQSLNPGQVDVIRYDPLVESYTSKNSKVDGHTPLHTALHLGVRLLETGTESKQIIVITDGHPCFVPKSGGLMPLSELQYLVRAEVHKARKSGINVTCLMIGSEVPKEQLQRMFGLEANWKVISNDRLGLDLVNVVTSSFVKFLKTR